MMLVNAAEFLIDSTGCYKMFDEFLITISDLLDIMCITFTIGKR